MSRKLYEDEIIQIDSRLENFPNTTSKELATMLGVEESIVKEYLAGRESNEQL